VTGELGDGKVELHTRMSGSIAQELIQPSSMILGGNPNLRCLLAMAQ
jgi:hypothetical protein